MTAHSTPATVLIVEDEQPVADLYAQFLTSTYTVHTAADGTEALDRLNRGVDVVLLDRRMPCRSGKEVLRAIREHRSNCRVSMVTAVTPTIDIVEMGFDDYLTKPVDNTELNEVVERLLDLNTYDSLVEEYYRLTSKKVTLEVEYAGFDLAKKEVYERLTNRLDELEKELQRTQETVSETDFRSLLDRPGNRTHGG